MEKRVKLTAAQRMKLNLLYPYLKKNHTILDLGCGNMWLTRTLKNSGYRCEGFALTKPADIIGDIKTYRFKKHSYDVVIALEFIEHVSCFEEIKHILKPGGLLIISTPVPHFDWLCLLGEKLRLLQDRGTPHSNLMYLKSVPFPPLFQTTLFGVVQFGVFRNRKKSYRPTVLKKTP